MNADAGTDRTSAADGHPSAVLPVGELDRWIHLDALLQRMWAGQLAPTAVPEPRAQTICSDALNALELRLYATPLVAQQRECGRLEGAGPEAVWSEWAFLRVSRFLLRDDPERLCLALEKELASPTISPDKRARYQMVFAVLHASLPTPVLTLTDDPDRPVAVQVVQ